MNCFHDPFFSSFFALYLYAKDIPASKRRGDGFDRGEYRILTDKSALTD